MENAKYCVWVVWLGAPAALLFGSDWVATAGRLVFWATLLVHVLEFAVKRPLFVRAGGPMWHHFAQTLIYGLFHWKPIQDRLDAAARG